MEYGKMCLIGVAGSVLRDHCGATGGGYRIKGDGVNYKATFPHRDGGMMSLEVIFGRRSDWKITRGDAVIHKGSAKTDDPEALLCLILCQMDSLFGKAA